MAVEVQTIASAVDTPSVVSEKAHDASGLSPTVDLEQVENWTCKRVQLPAPHTMGLHPSLSPSPAPSPFFLFFPIKQGQGKGLCKGATGWDL